MTASFVTVRDVALGELARFPGNARRGDVAAIRASVRRYGQYRALVVRDTGDGAAHQLGMKARGVELDPVYCDVTCRRYADHTGTQPELATEN